MLLLHSLLAGGAFILALGLSLSTIAVALHIYTKARLTTLIMSEDCMVQQLTPRGDIL